MGFIKMEKFLITARRDGCVYKTKSVGFRWFKIGNVPANVGDYQWQPTIDYFFGKEADLPLCSPEAELL